MKNLIIFGTFFILIILGIGIRCLQNYLNRKKLKKLYNKYQDIENNIKVTYFKGINEEIEMPTRNKHLECTEENIDLAVVEFSIKDNETTEEIPDE